MAAGNASAVAGLARPAAKARDGGTRAAVKAARRARVQAARRARVQAARRARVWDVAHL